MPPDPELEARLARFVERHVLDGAPPPVEAFCVDRPDLVEPLRALASSYLEISGRLSAAAMEGPGSPPAPRAGAESVQGVDAAAAAASGRLSPLPQFAGFRTIERLGAGGMGEVFKVEDLALRRIVAAKVVRRDRAGAAALAEFLGEARAMALFQDPRIVQIYEFRPEADPPVIIMQHVDGFELGRVAPSLEDRQRARLIEQVAEAVHHAHTLGIQHRDLKPSNIMVDASLRPRILDFGLSARDPARGHLRGTLPYLAPEQLDPGRPIDRRTDVYALGVILYEVLCSSLPYAGASDDDTMAAIRAGEPRLPAEVDPLVPEPLQAIALKAMEADPAARYPSAREMALDLRRYLDGRPVLARPRVYASALEARVRPHVAHIEEWEQRRLVYPHEAERLKSAYRSLEAREEDWILSTRALSWSQIALYLGAFLLVAGSLFYFGAYRREVVMGLFQPFLVLGAPFLGLNVIAYYLYRRERRAVAVAFYLGGVALLPLFLMIVFNEAGIWVKPPDFPGQLFTDGHLSNTQLQVTILAACVWSAVLALRTRTIALSTVFTFLLFLLALAVLADLGLRRWVWDEQQWDLLALHLAPLVAVYAGLGFALERRKRPWFGRPLYLGGALVLVLVLELVALDGRAFAYLGLSMPQFHDKAGDQTLLDTIAALTLNGLAIYLVALAIERRGSEVMKRAGGLLFTLSPFLALKPLGYLSMTGEYSLKFDWIYLGLSLGACLVSHHRQRRSFYYAGLINTGWALWEIARHHEWLDNPPWAIALVVAGLLVLAVGYALNRRERSRPRPAHPR